MTVLHSPVSQLNTPSVDFAIGARVRVAGYGPGTFQGAAFELTPGTVEENALIADVLLHSGRRVLLPIEELTEVGNG